MSLFISLDNVIPRMPESPFSEAVSWKINKGEIWTVLGPNGSGKTLLSEIICGRYGLQGGTIDYPFLEELHSLEPDKMHLPHEYIRRVNFNSAYSMADFRKMYYQQRFNSTEAEDAPLVGNLFADIDYDSKLWKKITRLLPVENLMEKRLIQLSSGELRKVIIVQSLIHRPRMLIFDNPFIGLDAFSRDQLNKVLIQLNDAGIQLLFLVPSVKDIPDCCTHILQMEYCRITGIINPKDVKQHTISPDVSIDWSQMPAPTVNYSEVISMKNLMVHYGKHVIAKDINWQILRNEKWALLGPNGSGKSTLLSFIFGDHPQAYTQPLVLFGKQRGTGESIWDIKKHIGFTSSEMHLYYNENVSCLKVVASGFFDSIGLFRKCTEEQLQIVEKWFAILGVSPFMERSFLHISSGEQRLMLFMRAMVKNPGLLILDEPFHGLDADRKALCTAIVESFCSQPDKSLIYVTHRREEIPTCVNHFMELGK
jgi:molybdate transport system ATP-binding protein